MCERLGEVPDQPLAGDVVLLAQEPEVVSQAQQPLEERAPRPHALLPRARLVAAFLFPRVAQRAKLVQRSRSIVNRNSDRLGDVACGERRVLRVEQEHHRGRQDRNVRVQDPPQDDGFRCPIGSL